jgi:hypothetical protein
MVKESDQRIDQIKHNTWRENPKRERDKEHANEFTVLTSRSNKGKWW